MQDREVSVWRVLAGSDARWFSGELGAHLWADDRFEKEFCPIPLIEKITLTEALTRLNELESSK